MDAPAPELAKPTTPAATGVLLANLGTPDEPTTAAVRRYLAEFLWDRRVIEVPRPLWWFVLRVILLIRPARSAANYRKVWTDEGSPLLAHLQRQARAIDKSLRASLADAPRVAIGMRYGNPSIESAIESLLAAGVEKLLVLPLYPQYSATTTASTFDAVADVFRRRRRLPEFSFISRYADDAGYIEALAASIESEWQSRPRAERLLFSFHGIPKKYVEAGDPYRDDCELTARLVAERLELESSDWSLSFQSRLGRAEWLRPYTDETLEQWGASGVSSVEVICPGFSADCLETLEEIDQGNREIFLGAGGRQFHYIPALNDQPLHIEALCSLIRRHLCNAPRQARQD